MPVSRELLCFRADCMDVSSKQPGKRPPRGSAAERSAAARERLARGRRRRQFIVVGSAVLAVVVVVAVLVIVKVVGGSGTQSGPKAKSASAAVLAKIRSVPSSTLDTIGTGTAQVTPQKIPAPPLASNGKPEILYIGAEYCPFCAAERWAMATALSRFGTLQNVGETTSSPNDVYPSTPTLSFSGASLKSSLVSFVPREVASNKVVNGQYQPLDKLTAAQQAIVSKYNAPPYQKQSGTIPFIDIGGRYLISGASYNPQVLHGKTHQQIADALSDPTSPIAKAVDGTANLITATVCQLTNQQPTSVCQSTGVKAAAAQLSGTA
jgi:hypothetical protein